MVTDMSWKTLTPADLKRRFAAGELAALQRAKVDLDDSAILVALQDVTALVRGYVAANRVNRLDVEGTLPATLVSCALDIALVDYSVGVAGVLLDAKGNRKAAREAALKLLQDVAAGRFAVDQPDLATPAQPEQRARPGPSVADPESVLESQ
jgi:phage gp36-like protein